MKRNTIFIQIYKLLLFNFNMKKIFVTFVLLLMLTSASLVIASSGGVSSLGEGLGYGMEGLIDAVEQMFRPLFEAVLGDYGEHMFERILFMIILVSIIYVVISQLPIFENKTWIIWIITISVSLLATRFLTENQLIENILLPYTVLGVALTAGLPIIIYFYFVESFNDSAIARKILWIFYIVVFIGLWSSRRVELGTLSWIYMLSAVVAGIFFIFDGSIRKTIIKGHMKALKDENRNINITKVNRQLADLEKDMREGLMTEQQYKQRRKSLSKQIDLLLKK